MSVVYKSQEYGLRLSSQALLDRQQAYSLNSSKRELESQSRTRSSYLHKSCYSITASRSRANKAITVSLRRFSPRHSLPSIQQEDCITTVRANMVRGAYRLTSIMTPAGWFDCYRCFQRSCRHCPPRSLRDDALDQCHCLPSAQIAATLGVRQIPHTNRQWGARRLRRIQLESWRPRLHFVVTSHRARF
jgi:hypothetical protein